LFKVSGICGSPRANGNTEILLEIALNEFDKARFKTEKIPLREYVLKPCFSCGYCVENQKCCIEDAMTSTIIPRLVDSHVIIIASPVYFNNVSGQVKVLMDRTWCIRGRLKDKIGGGIVVGRGYGLESALTAIHAFMFKHEMILGHRGVSGTAYEKGEIMMDKRAIEDAKDLAKRLSELCRLNFAANEQIA
jgi:multimeric flavodoxin WrbA